MAAGSQQDSDGRDMKPMKQAKLNLSRRTVLSAAGGMAPAVRAAIQDGLAERPRNTLSDCATRTRLADSLLPRDGWKPFPPAAQRADWEGLPQDVRGPFIEAGEERLQTPWPHLPATLFLEFKRNGNRSRYEKWYFERRKILHDLVLAECIEGKGRFMDAILDAVWCISEETYWGIPADVFAQKAGVDLPDAADPVVALFSAETSALISWTHYLLGPELDRISPLVRERMWREVNRRILTPTLARRLRWMSLGNNWNPWISSNWLTSALLMERDEARRLAAVHGVIGSLDRFLSAYAEDGGCDEGPSYWFRAGASLFDCLELLYSATGGRFDVYSDPQVQNVGKYIYRVHIAGDYYFNYADASVRNHSGGPAKRSGGISTSGDLVFRYGRRIRDAKLQALGASIVRGSGDSIGRTLPALFDLIVFRAAPQAPPLVRDAWLPGIQVMAARRREGSAEGLYLAAQGGHNANRNHNHNDVGNFIVYADGEPAIVDVGIVEYEAKTFGSGRYDIPAMQSAYHNLPTIDGVMQGTGREFEATEVAYRATDAAAELALNIEKAYPAAAGVASWRRNLRLDRARNEVHLQDRWSLNRSAGRIQWTLMTPAHATVAGQGKLVLAGNASGGPRVEILYDGMGITPTIEEMALEDRTLKSSWGGGLRRILLTMERPSMSGELNVRFRQ